MQIEKNIAATLKSEMQRRGKTLMEFSTELGIPRSTLQGYLKGTSHPRADSMEDLAEKLGISLVDLVSGTSPANTTVCSCLDTILLEAQALHPRAAPIVRDAISLLRSAFRLSDDLYDSEKTEPVPECPEDTYRYLLHELRVPFYRAPSYGILVKKRLPDGWATVAVVGAISDNRADVLRLIERCTALQLSPEHLFDVIHDSMAQEYLDF